MIKLEDEEKEIKEKLLKLKQETEQLDEDKLALDNDLAELENIERAYVYISPFQYRLSI